jgi:single-strand DNA-binding protein
MRTLTNHVTLVGNMGMDADITKFEDGKKVARFSLATDKSYRSKDGKMHKDTAWHRLFAWGNLAEFIESFGQKGKQVAIHGCVVNRTYLNRTGEKSTITEIEVRHIIGL